MFYTFIIIIITGVR